MHSRSPNHVQERGQITHPPILLFEKKHQTDAFSFSESSNFENFAPAVNRQPDNRREKLVELEIKHTMHQTRARNMHVTKHLRVYDSESENASV